MDTRDLPSQHSALTVVRRPGQADANDVGGGALDPATEGSSGYFTGEGKQYHVLSVIGRGGFGTVYHARLDGRDGFVKDVAIKLLHDVNPSAETLARFRDEARILGRTRDRATVSVEPPVRLGDRWAVVMELVDGVDCRRLLRDLGRFPARVAVEIVEEVARTLDNLYRHPDETGEPMRLLHRDIKPSNIQITPTGALKVLDFGIARAHFASRESETMSQIAGTLGYIAPERVDGIEDACGDIYGLGVVLEELVSGRRPVRPGEEPSALRNPAPTSAGPPEVMALAAEMRAADPRHRPTAAEVERRCAELARRIPGPSLREWAREHAAAAERLPPDGWVGTVLAEGVFVPDELPATSTRSTAVALLVIGLLAATSVAVFGGLTVMWAMWYARQPELTQAPPTPAPVEIVQAPVPPPAPVVAPVAEPVPVVAAAPPPAPNPVVEAPRPAPKPAAPSSGRVSFSGATGIELVSTSGARLPPGRVPAGTYQVLARFGEGPSVPAGSVSVAAGQEIALRCDARFQRCLSR